MSDIESLRKSISILKEAVDGLHSIAPRTIHLDPLIRDVVFHLGDVITALVDERVHDLGERIAVLEAEETKE